MSGRISVHVDGETAKLVAEVARIESRTPSQLAAEAIWLYVRLPSEAHTSLQHVQGSGSAEAMNLMLREVSRAISNASFDVALASMAVRLREIYGDRLGAMSEDEINEEAVRLTSLDGPTPSSASVRRAISSPAEAVRTTYDGGGSG